jgi:hypothetical protein
VALILGSLQTLLALANLLLSVPTVLAAVSRGAGASVWIAVGVQLLVLAALLQLAYYLVQVLREPRN